MTCCANNSDRIDLINSELRRRGIKAKVSMGKENKLVFTCAMVDYEQVHAIVDKYSEKEDTCLTQTMSTPS
jgi:hypothetical protein